MYLMKFLKEIMFFSAVSVPFLQQWGGLNFSQIMFLQSWFIFWVFALEVPTGVVADKIGRKTSIYIGLFLNAVAVLIYGTFPIFYVFIFAEFLWAAALTFISGADEALMYDSLPSKNKTKRAKHVFANYAIFSTIGYMVAGPAGSIIAKYFPLNYPMLLSAVSLSLSFVVALTLEEPPVKKKVEEMKYFEMAFEGIKHLFRHKKLRSLAVNNALFVLISYYILWLWQPMIQKGNLDILYFGFVSFGMNLFGMILIKKTKSIERILGKKNTLTLIGVIPAIFFLFASFTSNLTLLIMSIFFILGARQARKPLMSAYMNEHVDSHNRATVNSAINMSASFLIIIGNLFIGMLIDYSLDSAMMLLGVLGVVFNLVSRPSVG